MVNPVKQQALNFIKTFIEALRRDKHLVENRLMVAFVESYLSKKIDVSDVRIPSQYARFCLDLFSSTELTVETISWRHDDSIGFKRFDRLVQLLTRSLPGYDTAAAGEILSAANTLSGDRTELPGTGLDVAQHFLISSSFGLKGKLLHNIVRFMRPMHCVEIGTAYGMSTMFSAQALRAVNPDGKLWTIEAADLQYRISSELLAERFGNQVACLHGMSTECLPKVIQEAKSVDFYFHDGGHQYDNIVDNFNQIKPALRSGSIVVVDDISWWDQRILKEDPRCYEAWKVIANDPIVGCAIEINNDIGIALIA